MKEPAETLKQYIHIQFEGEPDQVADAIRITESYARRLAQRAHLKISTLGDTVNEP